MVAPVSSQTNVPQMNTAQAPTKVDNTAPQASPVPAPYSPIKEKLEKPAQELKESAAVKASEAMHNLATAESSKVTATAAPANPVVNTQTVVQAYQASTPPVA